MYVFEKITKAIKEMKDAKAKAFSVAEVPSTVMYIGLGVVIGAVMLLVLNGFDTSSSVTAGSATDNALKNGISGVGNIFGQYPLLGTIAGYVIILGFVLGALYFVATRSNKGGL